MSAPGTVGRHLLAELHGCDAAILNDPERLRPLMLQAAEKAKAHVIGEVTRGYAPQGVTCLLVLAESHFSLHTWPEARYAAADFYTCGSLLPELALELLRDGLMATRFDLLSVERGRPDAPPFKILDR
ncbi:MAG TPA: adenosylmethionine decarboxylase [Polyangiaceae bacterium]|nr:adenosylmethionine decarboxylase [Polyangiaceae bacterium]